MNGKSLANRRMKSRIKNRESLEGLIRKTSRGILKKTIEKTNVSYITLIMNMLLSNGRCHIVATFKDYLIQDDHSEFLHREYKIREAKIRLKKMFKFYHITSVIYPNYTPIIEARYIYKNIMQKQKLIDQQQELADMMSYKKKKDKKKIFLKDDIKENVFNTFAYEDIMNQSNSVLKRILCVDDRNPFSDEFDKSEEEIEKMNKIVNNIQKYEIENSEALQSMIKSKILITNTKKLKLKEVSTTAMTDKSKRDRDANSIHSNLSISKSTLSPIKNKPEAKTQNSFKHTHQRNSTFSRNLNLGCLNNLAPSLTNYHSITSTTTNINTIPLSTNINTNGNLGVNVNTNLNTSIKTNGNLNTNTNISTKGTKTHRSTVSMPKISTHQGGHRHNNSTSSGKYKLTVVNPAKTQSSTIIKGSSRMSKFQKLKTSLNFNKPSLNFRSPPVSERAYKSKKIFSGNKFEIGTSTRKAKKNLIFNCLAPTERYHI